MRTRRMAAAAATAAALWITSGWVPANAQERAPFSIRLRLEERFSEPLEPGRPFVLLAELSSPLPPDGPEGPVPGEQILFDGARYESHEGYACAGFCPIIYGYTLLPLEGASEVTIRIPAGALTDAYGRRNENAAEFSAAVGAVPVPALPAAAAAVLAALLWATSFHQRDDAVRSADRPNRRRGDCRPRRAGRHPPRDSRRLRHRRASRRNEFVLH